MGTRQAALMVESGPHTPWGRPTRQASEAQQEGCLQERLPHLPMPRSSCWMTAICATWSYVPNKPASWPSRGTVLSLRAESWRDQLQIAPGSHTGPMEVQFLSEGLLRFYTLRGLGAAECHAVVESPPVSGLETPTGQKR